MSDERVVNIFDQYRVKAEPCAANTQETYQAAITERPGKRAWSIRIHYSNGVIEQISYSYRKYDLSLSPDRLGIVFTTGAAFLTGKNLRLLLDDLQDERIRALHPFDPAIHKAPKEGAPVIERIEWKTAEELKNQ